MPKCRIRVFQADWDPVEIYFGGDKIIGAPSAAALDAALKPLIEAIGPAVPDISSEAVSGPKPGIPVGSVKWAGSE